MGPPLQGPCPLDVNVTQAAASQYGTAQAFITYAAVLDAHCALRAVWPWYVPAGIVMQDQDLVLHCQFPGHCQPQGGGQGPFGAVPGPSSFCPLPGLGPCVGP